MKTTLTILFAAIWAATSGCLSPSAADGAKWRAQANKVTTGMPRSEVEKWLPPYPNSPCFTMISKNNGNRFVQHYWLDEHWSVKIEYDHKEIPRDEKGSALERSSPDNKVLSEPVLSRQPMPILDFKHAKTIDPSAKRDN